jgi:hypothetical protein
MLFMVKLSVNLPPRKLFTDLAQLSVENVFFISCSAIGGGGNVVSNQGDEIRDGCLPVYRRQRRSSFRQQADDGPRPL